MEILLLLPIVFLVSLFAAIILLFKYYKFNKSTYQVASGNHFFQTIFDKGNNGEYLTYAHLEKLEGPHRLMTNLYIPKKDGTTTEIDLIMLSPSGIYVFESKNYSGWIFGDEKNKNWVQTYKNNQKYRFFNPIWQNKGHINALKTIIEEEYHHFFKSYIIFSERCTLKKINVTSPNVKVLNRNLILKAIKHDIEETTTLMSVAEINYLYFQLQKYTRADDQVKHAHIASVRMKRF